MQRNILTALPLIFVALCACDGRELPHGDTVPRERQTQATEIVWGLVLGLDKALELPPEVRWIEGEDLDCEGDPTRFAWGEPGWCYGGWFTSEDWAARVAVLPGQTFSDTPFAHELCHAWEFLQTGDGANHEGKCFTERLALANEALRAYGL